MSARATRFSPAPSRSRPRTSLLLTLATVLCCVASCVAVVVVVVVVAPTQSADGRYTIDTEERRVKHVAGFSRCVTLFLSSFLFIPPVIVPPTRQCSTHTSRGRVRDDAAHPPRYEMSLEPQEEITFTVAESVAHYTDYSMRRHSK